MAVVGVAAVEVGVVECEGLACFDPLLYGGGVGLIVGVGVAAAIAVKARGRPLHSIRAG